MQSIVSKGKDINDAVRLGLELLEAAKNEVNIEIIQYDTKGFLGIGSKEAVVKLTRVNEINSNKDLSVTATSLDLETLVSDLEEGEERSLADEEVGSEKKKNTDIKASDLDGKVWVKNGNLYFQTSPTQFPMVTIYKGIKLFRNEELVNEKTIILSDKESYRLETDCEEKETTWEIKMDADKLNVFLHVKPGSKLIRTIPNIEADHHIDLRPDESVEVNKTLSYAEVIQELEKMRVIHGFNQDEILKALETEEAGTFKIASGQVPVPGKDGWVEFTIKTDIKDGPQEKGNGRVDFRETKDVPSIDRGKLMAIIHPPIPGRVGVTVTNQPLPAKQTLPVILKVGKGATLVDDKVVSTDSGRPRIEKRGRLVKISVMPKLTHVGNVDLSSGNIRFKGDVEIFGEVEERMIVEADGDVYIHSSVNFSQVTASGAITSFGSIVGSEISAGKNNMLVTELGHLLGIINQNIEKIIAVIKQLSISPAFKSSDFSRGGLQPLIRILLEKKFKNFPPVAKKYVEVVGKGQDFLHDDVWREVSVAISQLFLSLTNEITSLERIEQLSKKIKELHELSQTPIEPDCYITIPNAQNSSLYCSGNILILGQGCINTKIHAGGTLKINGVIRGGEVYGRLGAEIHEVGSLSGTPTMISVPSDQTISMDKVMEGTVIQIGHGKYKFTETKQHITAKLDKNERIIFE